MSDSSRREWSTLSRAPSLRPEPKVGLFSELPNLVRVEVEARERVLHDGYDLGLVREFCGRKDYREVLDLLQLLDSCAAELAFEAGPCRWIDVGARSWNYVAAIERFANARRRAGSEEPFHLTGIEIDGNARTPDGSTCAAYGRAHAGRVVAAARAGDGHGPTPRLEYEVTDFREWERSGSPAGVVSMLFPFVTAPPLLASGLPFEALDPTQLVLAAAGQLAAGGRLLTLHPSKAEADRMVSTVAASGAPLALRRVQRHQTKILPYWVKTQDRHAVVFERR